MNQVPDRKKMRRHYLRKRRKLFVLAACYAALLLAVLISVLHSPLAAHWPRWLAILYFAVMGIVLAGNAGVYLKTIRRAQEQARQAYVPPVTLPAEEVLVRMAEEPSALQETLLRAAGTGEETKAEELLRVATGASEQPR